MAPRKTIRRLSCDPLFSVPRCMSGSCPLFPAGRSCCLSDGSVSIETDSPVTVSGPSRLVPSGPLSRPVSSRPVPSRPVSSRPLSRPVPSRPDAPAGRLFTLAVAVAAEDDSGRGQRRSGQQGTPGQRRHRLSAGGGRARRHQAHRLSGRCAAGSHREARRRH